MIRSFPLLAILAIVSSSCSQEAALDNPAVTIKNIPVSVGDTRKEVISSMGMPNAASGRGIGEITSFAVAVPGTSREEMKRLSEGEKASFESDPEVFSSDVWRYYGLGGNDRFTAIYFKGDTVIGITHGMTQDMIGSGYAK